jgi:KaiC/GvpD/RAD55 family RecA-like ATPase
MNLMLNAALQYQQMGFSVIPLRPKEKLPLFPWSEFQKRRATESEIRKWWMDCPNANVGIVTGTISGVAVVDLDGTVGISNGVRMSLPSTMTSLTGGGRQLFYKYREGVCNSASKIAEGVDVRGEGGYIVAPPSVHPNGKRYQWLMGSVSNVDKLADFPILTSVSTQNVGRSVQLGTGWIHDALNGLKEGNRDATFARIVGKLHHSGLDPVTIRALLHPHAVRCSFDSLDKVVRSITRYEREETSTGNGPTPSIGSFLESEESVEWLVPGVFARKSVGFVAGLPEVMKTWLLIDLAVECARDGGKWLQLFPVEKARVLFIDQERFKGETQRRFKNIISAKGLRVDDLKDSLFIRCGTTTRLDLDVSYRAFKEELTELRPDLVIVDSFATFHVGDENDRMAIQGMLERVKELRNEIGCTFLFVDHEGKAAYGDIANNEAPSAGRIVGSIGKVAAAETVLTVRRYDDHTSTVWHTKSTLSQCVPCFNTTIADVPEGITVSGVRG